MCIADDYITLDVAYDIYQFKSLRYELDMKDKNKRLFLATWRCLWYTLHVADECVWAQTNNLSVYMYSTSHLKNTYIRRKSFEFKDAVQSTNSTEI